MWNSRFSLAKKDFLECPWSGLWENSHDLAGSTQDERKISANHHNSRHRKKDVLSITNHFDNFVYRGASTLDKPAFLFRKSKNHNGLNDQNLRHILFSLWMRSIKVLKFGWFFFCFFSPFWVILLPNRQDCMQPLGFSNQNAHGFLGDDGYTKIGYPAPLFFIKNQEDFCQS